MALVQADPLRIVLDTDTVAPHDGEVESYLIGLMDLTDVELLRYSDQGPPEADLRESDFYEHPYATGWLMIFPVDDPTYVGVTTYSHDGKSIRSSWVSGGDMVEAPLEFSLLQFEDPESHRDGIRRDLMLWRACEAADVAIVVTNRSVLVNPIPGLPGLHSTTTAATPSEALVMAGLWLRARGQYIVHAGRQSIGRTDRAGFYSIGAAELVPARWRWISALRYLPPRLGFVRDLILTQHVRVVSALKARDRERSSLLSMSSSDALDEAIDCVVEVAWNLMGAFDATAQLIELLSPTGTDLHEAKWQRADWRKRQHQLLPTVIDTARKHRPIFDVIRVLRNTVHSRIMDAVRVKPLTVSGRDDEHYIGLPPRPDRDPPQRFSGHRRTWELACP